MNRDSAAQAPATNVRDIYQGSIFGSVVGGYGHKIYVNGSLSGGPRAVVRWLHSAPFDVKHRYISTKQRQPGTGGWLLKDPRFKGWLSSIGSFLWLHGIPGSGKTVLTSTVIDSVQLQMETDKAFAYFYVDFSEAKTRQPKYILRSLLAQLIACKPEMIQSEFHDLMRGMEDNNEPPSDVLELSDLIVRASYHHSDVTLVIDAVDECMPREEFLPFFTRLEPANHIRIYVTSRRERDIRDLFVNRPNIPLEEVRASVLTDMESHIRAELETVGYSKIPKRIKDEIITSLLQGSGGMFRWIQCQLDQIRKMRTNKKILETLESLPSGLYETYERILQNITPFDVWFAKKVISWIIVAARPLRLREIVEAMAVDVHAKCLDRDNTLNDEEDILEICSSLVDYDKQAGVISLSHYSVQEYFLSSALESSHLSTFYMSVFESHRELSKICLCYILLSCFSDGPCLTEELFTSRHTEYPLLHYAVRHWDTHTEECRGAEDIVCLVKDLFLSDTNTQNYLGYVQARHGSAFGYHPDQSPLSCLTQSRLTWVLKCLHETPPNWYNEEQGRYGTPLANAVWRDDLEMITYLLDAGVDINKHCENFFWAVQEFPLYMAAKRCFPKSFGLLMDRGADPHLWRTTSRDNTLHEVCRNGQLAMAQRLVRQGVTANVRNRAGETALHLAIRRRSLDVTQLLVEEGDAKVLTRIGKTAIHFAIEVRSAPITAYLLGHCNDIELSSLRNLSVEQIEWAVGEPWYTRLYSAIAVGGEEGGHFSWDLTGADIIRVQAILQGRYMLPHKVMEMVLDYAEYWSRTSVKRADSVAVRMNTVQSPYISIHVTGRGKSPVRRIIFHIKSHDQGWSDYPEAHGTYEMSGTYFEVRVRRPSLLKELSLPPLDRTIQINVHASWETRMHTNVWDAWDPTPETSEWVKRLETGDVLEVFALAKYPGWVNYVLAAEIELYCGWT